MEEIIKTAITSLISVVGTYTLSIIDTPPILINNDDVRKAIRGTWKVNWYEYEKGSVDKSNLIIEETIIISRVYKRTFVCKVTNNQKLAYSLKGKIYDNAVTFEFHGVSKPGVHGTGILHINLGKSKMSGIWLQIGDNKESITGPCIWEKIS